MSIEEVIALSEILLTFWISSVEFGIIIFFKIPLYATLSICDNQSVLALLFGLPMSLFLSDNVETIVLGEKRM